MAYKKPKINQQVYCIYNDSIMLKLAERIGEDSFLTEYTSWYFDDSKRWYYDDYNITWTLTFNKAKALLKKKLGVKKLNLVERHKNDYWEVEE